MQFFTDEAIRGLLASSLETAALGPEGFYDVGRGPGSAEGADIDWLCIADQRGSVVDDVRRIRNHPLVPDTIPVYGFLYDVRSGRRSRSRRRLPSAAPRDPGRAGRASATGPPVLMSRGLARSPAPHDEAPVDDRGFWLAGRDGRPGGRRRWSDHGPLTTAAGVNRAWRRRTMAAPPATRAMATAAWIPLEGHWLAGHERRADET